MDVPFRSKGPRVTLGNIVGTDLFFGRGYQRLSLGPKEIALHKHILGVSGTGKSRLIANLFLSFLRNGIGTTLIDPMGSTAELLLKTLIAQGFYESPEAYTRVIWVDFRDTDSPDDPFIPFNILKMLGVPPAAVRKLVAESFKRIWPELAEHAAMFDTMISASLKVLQANDLSLARMAQLLDNKEYRKPLVKHPDVDDFARGFFEGRWDRLSAGDQTVIGGALIRRAYLIVDSPVTLYSLGQSENLLDIRRFLDEGTAVIVNLGNILDLETRRLVGSLLTHAYEIAALSRLPRTDLPQHQLLVDEFGLFSTQSAVALADILSRTRQVGLFLTLSHQDFTQTSERLVGALSNARVKISFAAGPEDAYQQARSFFDYDPELLKNEAASETGQPLFHSVQEQLVMNATQLKNLPDRHALVRIDGGKPIEVEVVDVPDHDVPESRVEEVKAGYYERYYHRRRDIVLQDRPTVLRAQRIIP